MTIDDLIGNSLTREEMIEEGYVVIDETDGAESGFCYYPLGVFTDKFFEEERYGAD